MNKFATLSATGIVGSGAILTGAYALGAFGDNNDIVPSNASDFGSSNGGKCVQDLFSGVSKIENKSKQLENPQPIEPFTDDASSYKGCVLVSWERFKPKVAGDNKWSGVLRFVWTLSREKLGLIAYSNILVYADKKKSESSFYLISQNENSSWDVASKRENLNVTLNYDQIPKSSNS